MFRTLGLRHLIVVNKRNQVLGMVTRHDLVATHYLSHEASTTSGGSSTSTEDTSSSTSSSSVRRRKDKRQQRQRQKRVDSINKTIGVELELPTISMDV